MAGLTTTGIEIKDVDEILDDIESAQLADIDANLNVEADSVLGQLNGIYGGALAEAWELLEEIYQSAYPDTASGQSLSYVSALTGAIRQAATKAELSVHLEGTATTQVPAGTQCYVDGDPDSLFQTTALATIAEEGDIDFIAVTIEAVTAGSYPSAYHQTSTAVSDMVFANASGATVDITSAGSSLPAMVAGDRFDIADHATNNGSFVVDTVNTSTSDYSCTMYDDTPANATSEAATILTATDTLVISTPVSGLDAITIQADYTAGLDEEVDADLRSRREQLLALPGTSTVDAIRADMLTVRGVNACTVFENVTGDTDANGLPPNSIEVLVYSSAAPLYTDQDVANQIWASKPAGTQAYGSDGPHTVTDSSGNTHEVYFSEPSTVNAYAAVTLTKTDTGTYIGDSSVQQAIVDWGDTLNVGQDVYASDIVKLVAGLEGVVSVDTTATFVDDDATVDEYVIDVGSRDLAVFITARITITST